MRVCRPGWWAPFMVAREYTCALGSLVETFMSKQVVASKCAFAVTRL